MKLRKPEALDSARHDRSRFTCGEPQFDEWLRIYAGQSRRKNTAATWVIADDTDRVVAYATMSLTSVALRGTPPGLAKGSPDPIPALLIGRFAVDQNVSGLGVGTELVRNVLAMALTLNETAAFRVVVVNAFNASAVLWWMRLGFRELYPGTEDAFDLYLETKEIRRTIARL